MKNQATFDMTRVAALDKAMHYHSTFNRAQPGGAQWPHQEAPKATPEQVIETAQKFLGFLMIERKAMQARAKR